MGDPWRVDSVQEEVRAMEKNSKKKERLFSCNAIICRHFLNGTVDMPKLCLRRYDCSRCAFDQWLDDADTERDILKRHACRELIDAAA
jgi:hypothetical protein